MISSADERFWDTLYAHLPLAYPPSFSLFKDLFDRYLTPNGTCFEVGCYPGNFLIYLGKRFGYVVSGIDTTPYVTSRLPEHIVHNGVKIGEFYQQDFLTFESDKVYDVVCSFGFLEHFHNTEEVIEKHIRLVKPGGTLVLSCPNFRGLNYILYRLLDPATLRPHVIAAMNLRRWRRALERNGMAIQYQGYYRTAGFHAWLPVLKSVGAVGEMVCRTGDRPNRSPCELAQCLAVAKHDKFFQETRLARLRLSSRLYV